MLPPTPRTAQPEIAGDARRARILEGAMGVFMTYGFQRTTMDDIAKAAEISRPALYLQFRNKTDIYRALASTFLDEIVGRARAAMSRPGTLGERLGGAMHLAYECMLEIEESPHGAEMLDMRNKLAADLVGEGRATFRALIEAAVDADVARRGIRIGDRGLAAGTLADCLLDAIDGMKLRGLPAGEQRRAIDAYIAVLTNAVAG